MILIEMLKEQKSFFNIEKNWALNLAFISD